MRTLVLRKEALAELSTSELSAVGGAGTTDLLTNACVSHRCTGLMCAYTEIVCLEA